MKNFKATTVKSILVSLLTLAAGAGSSLARAEEVKGDAQAGAKKNAMCIGCHAIVGYQASFPQIYKVPKISGQNAKYLVAALDAYRKGDRKHPTMRAIAGSLTDQDIADLAAFYEANGKLEGEAAAPATAELPEALKGKLAACVACHGANFNNTTDPANPRLAGQHADYLKVSLHAYQTQNNSMVGRSNATMVGMAASLNAEEIDAVAKYLSGLPGEVKTVPHAKFR